MSHLLKIMRALLIGHYLWYITLCFCDFAYLISGALDLHNNAAKLLRVRYLWDKHLIIKPLSRRAGVNRKLNKDEAHNVMSNLYYPEVRKLKTNIILNSSGIKYTILDILNFR